MIARRAFSDHKATFDNRTRIADNLTMLGCCLPIERPRCEAPGKSIEFVVRSCSGFNAMKILGIFICLCGILCGVAALSFSYLGWIATPIGLPCQESSYDGILDIEYGFGGERINFLSGGNSLLLAGGTGHHRGTFPLLMFDGLSSGSRAQVAYCRNQIVHMKSGEREIFDLTQKSAEHNRLSAMRLGVRIAIFAFLAAILGHWLARRALDS